jgi:DNA-binding NarL/FixJ family response regulator
MKVLIADDHSVVREGLKEIIRKMDEVSVIEEASDGLEAFEKIKNNSYNLIILDISMPGMSGLDILQALKSKKDKPHILILSVHPQTQYAIRAMRLGASGYLSKESVSDELIEAIRKVSSGGKYISSALTEKILLDKTEDSDKALHEKLSDREFQIMCLIAKGKSVTEIAKEFFLSDKTISTYRARILEKMGLRKNAELTLYAIRNNLIE